MAARRESLERIIIIARERAKIDRGRARGRSDRDGREVGSREGKGSRRNREKNEERRRMGRKEERGKERRFYEGVSGGTR